MTKQINSLEDLISIDANVIDAIKAKNADKVKAVVTKKSARVVDALKAQEERANAAAVEFETLKGNKEHIDLVRQYAAHNAAAVEPITALDEIEARMRVDMDAIKAKYADDHRDALAAVDVALHNVREALAAVSDLGVYSGTIATATAPEVAARLNKRGRGRGGKRAVREYVEGDILYFAYNGVGYQSVATENGVMFRGADTALSTAAAVLADEIAGADETRHLGTYWKADQFARYNGEYESVE